MSNAATTDRASKGDPSAENGSVDAKVLLILAVDHRNSLDRDLYGLKGAISPAQAARISADKLLVYQALLDALPEPAQRRPAGNPGR